ncbi:hypothetical protein NQZ79_g6017 [Umbelopsis isabellina]|nr:hypothetical protein NQZ79_g6017 [Umbelopsis isabellina]
MGQAKSKENQQLARSTHFSAKEINNIRQDFEKANATVDKTGISEDEFKETVRKYVPDVCPEDDVFFNRLYAAFDVENSKHIGFREFVDGLSVFMKGTPEEKLELSFKLYDMDHDGYLTQAELERVMTQLSVTFSKEDQTNEIRELITRMFEDVDVNGDGKLSLHEYKLSAMKEPLIVDFLEQFLANHHLSQQPRPPSRPASIRSIHSVRSPGSPSSQRLSVRLSQAELLDYTHQHQKLNSVNNTPSHSPRSSNAPSSPSRSNSPVTSISGTTNNVSNNNKRSSERLSRGVSHGSLDAALNTL